MVEKQYPTLLVKFIEFLFIINFVRFKLFLRPLGVFLSKTEGCQRFCPCVYTRLQRLSG